MTLLHGKCTKNQTRTCQMSDLNRLALPVGPLTPLFPVSRELQTVTAGHKHKRGYGLPLAVVRNEDSAVSVASRR
eukprot:CAMPEP_0179312584 /NCGR_PEP_ID=MMETSP0797-20121207/53348_1 /TAXON_ID=47934 /ORGANISM="Dinophysis acuminata, Strain DAEP01" /LENGTH=74 /DNA_ID=CAMNT_0021022535 /DNA_START=36 /DNA_END=256 /DNA_ORIENTATION=-